MTVTHEKLVDDVLSLPVDMRLALIDRLLRSVQAPSQPEIDRLWAEEAERRIDQITSGEVQAEGAGAPIAQLNDFAGTAGRDAHHC